jgi:hypothetical protein
MIADITKLSVSQRIRRSGSSSSLVPDSSPTTAARGGDMRKSDSSGDNISGSNLQPSQVRTIDNESIGHRMESSQDPDMSGDGSIYL